MILIADSGGTSTSWRLVENGTHRDFISSGMNPYYLSKEELENIVSNELISQFDISSVKHIFFYGAGCSSDESRQKIAQVLESSFANCSVKINHDLLGAARALCHTSHGIVGILGTGSNSCFYDGADVVKNIPSLGYVLGDEGGGAQLGKILLRDFARNQVPLPIKSELENLGFSKSTIEQRTYQESNPIAFLSSFAPFIHNHLSSDYISGIVGQSFDSFIQNCLFGYEELPLYPVSFSGSIAFHFREILIDRLLKNNIIPGQIISNPMDGLVEFHMAS